jgi:raffinose/stachyose/melibiose transport system substrate-binding protein
VLTDAEIKDWIGTGGVPIANGADSQLGASKDADFLKFVYGVASKAKTFPQSWDQALSPTAAEKLLDNIAQLFQLSVTPQQFATNMNQVIGQ